MALLMLARAMATPARAAAAARAEAARGWMDTGYCEDVPHRGGTDPVPQPGQLALDLSVSPSGVLLGQAQDEFLDC